MTADEDEVRMRKIKEQEAHVRQLELEYKSQQEATKEARQDLSAAIARLRMLIRGEIEDQGELDFGDEEGNQSEPSDQTWDALLSSTRLEDAITLTKAQRKKFEDLGVITVKHFEQLRAAELAGIAGSLHQHFSEATAEKLEDAVLDWLDRKRIERGSGRTATTASDKPRTVGGKPVKARS